MNLNKQISVQKSPWLILSLIFANCLALSCAALAGTQVNRRGSQLELRWLSSVEGSWDLVDSSGNVCASGSTRVGSNSIIIPKIAAPTDLRFRRRDSNGSERAVESIAGFKNLSHLTKPDGSAVIYQVPIRTFFARGNGPGATGQINDLTSEKLLEMKSLGVDYIWLTGVLEHASRDQVDPDVVKGDAGSFYAVYDNWDVAGEIGTLADFEALIERAHGAGLRVMMDFVGNHTARVHKTDVACKQALDFGWNDESDRFFRSSNNYYYIEGTSFTPPTTSSAGADGVFDSDLNRGDVQLEAPAKVTGNDIIQASPGASDWFETVKLNYGWDLLSQRGFYDPRPRTWDQMTDVAKYWLEKGVDGFRVDFAHAVPIEFWRFFASELRRIQPEVFLLAEAYESDIRMKIPGFSYLALLDAGFDSIYDSDLYWALRNQAVRPGDMRSATPGRSAAFSTEVVNRGYSFTHYMENHDELRVASRYFAPWVGDRGQRANLGLAYTAYLGLLPGHLLMHSGQELQEDATVSGPFAGDNGHTSIFDFVYQAQSRIWNNGPRPQWMIDFRSRYQDLLQIKKRPAFRSIHSSATPSMIDLDGVQGGSEQSRWISSFIRYAAGEAYLVVTNSDPFVEHEATIHLTNQTGVDSHGALAVLGVVQDGSRYQFEEIFSRRGWMPQDPAVQGQGIPGWVLYRAGDVPSGVYLGAVPPATTYVFKVSHRTSMTTH